MKDLVSVIIATYNRAAVLKETLNSIYAQDYKHKEIIIVDDHSSDETQSMNTYFPGLKIIKNKTNKGPAYSRNVGIVSSSGEFILFLDDDIKFLKPGSISSTVDLMKSDAKIGQLGGSANLENGRLVSVNGSSLRNGREPYFSPCISSYESQILGIRRKECDFVPTFNCMVHRRAAFDVHGFDPYYVYQFEDTDLGLMLLKNGYRNYVAYDAAVLHKAYKRNEEREHYYFLRNRIRFLIKHYGFRWFFLYVIKDYLRIFLEISIRLFKVSSQRFEDIKECQRTTDYEPKRSVLYLFRRLAYTFKAHLWNIIYFRQTIHSRHKDFLSAQELANFKKPRF